MTITAQPLSHPNNHSPTVYSLQPSVQPADYSRSCGKLAKITAPQRRLYTGHSLPTTAYSPTTTA